MEKPSITVSPRTLKDKTKYSINFVVSYKGTTKHLAVGIVIQRTDWLKILDAFNLEEEYVNIRQTLQIRLARCLKLAEEVVPFNIETFLKIWELKKVTYVYAGNDDVDTSGTTNDTKLPKGASMHVSNKAILANGVPDIFKCYNLLIDQETYKPNKQWHITARKVLQRYLATREDELGFKDTFPFSEAQPDFLYEFEHWMLITGGKLDGEPYADNSYSNTMKSLRRAFTFAEEDYGLSSAFYPFTTKRKNKKLYFIKKPGKRYRIMKEQAFQKFLTCIPVKGSFTEVAKDFFIIMAEANGSSPIDVLEWRNKDYADKMLLYERRKTKNSVSEPVTVPVHVSKLLAALIKKYRNKSTSPNARLLNFIPDGLKEDDFLLHANNFKAKANYHLAKICEAVEIDRITLYFARNLWANTQRKLRTDIIDIMKGLGHTNLNTTYKYLNDLEVLERSDDQGSGIVGALKKKKKKKEEKKATTPMHVVKRPAHTIKKPGGRAA